MKIYPWMISYIHLLEKEPTVIARYMEYPKKYITKGVIQWHLRGPKLETLTPEEKKALANASWKDIYKPRGIVKKAIEKTKGVSVHEDWRFAINDYLVGWSIVGTQWGYGPEKLGPDPDKVNKGFRAETKCFSEICNEWMYDVIDVDEESGIVHVKWHSEEELCKKSLEELARQPKVWLKVKGYVPPGQVGAAKEGGGLFIIKAKLDVVFGSQKPYFHEYFIKGGPFKDWTRFIIRGVKVPIIDPDTKKPIPGKYELMWRAMIPEDQTPYALSERAKKKNWYPPKDVIPVPPPWKKTDEFKEWLQRAKEFWKKQPKGTEKMAKKYPFVLHVITAMGPVHIRGIPNVEWHLRIKTDEGIRSWNIIGDPVRESPLAAFIEPSIDEKYFDYEGKLEPEHPINPFGFKQLEANCMIYDKGTVEYESEGTPEVIKLKFKGRLLKGEWKLTQEEKGSDIYALEKLSRHELMTKEFVLHLHEVPENSGKMHTDIRIKMNGYMEEFNLYHLEPWTTKEEEPIRAVRKKCYDVEGWFIKEGKGIRRKVGGIWTKVDVLDHGTVDIIEINPFFMSMMFHGKKLKGYYVAKKTDEGWIFMKSKLPHTELAGTGNPLTGDYYKPFKIEKKKGWNYYWVHIYDIKEFTRCVSENEARELYLKGINIPKQVLEVNVCLVPRKGTLPLARLQGIKVSDEWTEEQAIKWIKENALHTWSMTMIRKTKKEKSINEMVSVNDDGEGCETCQ